MSDFSRAIDYTPVVLPVYSRFSLGGTLQAMNAGWGTAVWPSANLALYIPFVLGTPFTVAKMFWLNGASVGTNSVDVGIYDSQGNRLVSSGSVLTSGASATQSTDITDTTLQPGLYYMAMSVNGTTNSFGRSNTLAAPLLRSSGVCEQASAFNLPATATFAGASTAAYVPVLAITGSTVI